MKIVLKYGLLSGFVLAGLVAVLLPVFLNRGIDMKYGEAIGYTAMVLSYLVVFFGIRSYREEVGGGAITFGKAFQVGILMTLITSAIYVIAWQIVYHNFVPDFADTYAQHVLDRMRESGATAEALAAEEKKMADFKRLYQNVFFNVGITFLEVFPVGLIVTLVSAGILRKKPAGAPLAAATT
jgi:hypothetical protein